jgi:uncharacterized membrane protein HdeD (DUF308 family)
MVFWITLIRGVLAISLAVALLVQPDKTRPMLGNFMGMFWLVSGIMSVRWSIRGERSRGLPLLAGLIGVVAGLGMLARHFAFGWVQEAVFFSVLGVVILLTGILHIVVGLRTGGAAGTRRRSWTGVLLGAFEFILGLLLIVEPLGRSLAVYLVAGIWALIGGVMLIGNALSIRRQSRESQPEVAPGGQASPAGKPGG